MKLAVAMSLAILFATIGDILFSKGMRSQGEVNIRRVNDVLPLVRQVFTHPIIIAGVCSMGIHFAAYVTALAWIDVSVANPLTALSYALATIYAGTFMHERVDRQRWGGVVLITLGAILVGLSS